MKLSNPFFPRIRSSFSRKMTGFLQLMCFRAIRTFSPSIYLRDVSKYLVGCYDSTAKLWNRSGECVASLKGHSRLVKAVKTMDSTEELTTCLTASHDGTIRGWKVDNSAIVTPLFIGRGHLGTVDCIETSKDFKVVWRNGWSPC